MLWSAFIRVPWFRRKARRRKNHGLWFRCKKSCLAVTTKAFLHTKVGKSEAVVQWVHPSQRGECPVLQTHPMPFEAKAVQPTGSVQPSKQGQLCRLVHHSPLHPQGMRGNKVQGCSISKVALPLTFYFFLFSKRMDSLKGINVLLKPSCLALSAYSFWQSLVLFTLLVSCAMLSLYFPWKKSIPEPLRQGVFGEAELHGDHTAEECRYLGLLWKDPAERSPGCTVLSISLPPPGFGREQIPSRIIGLRSWKVIQILH